MSDNVDQLTDKPVRKVTIEDLFKGPASFFALGAGLGLAPKAPGTFGTLLGIPLVFLMPQSLWLYLLVLAVLFGFGIWCCEVCSRQLGVHDHGAIVWDEVVGYLLTMIAVPTSIGWIVAGFIAFRVFDIVKPWPISWVDRHVHGGLGIMLDDVLAAVFAIVVMQLALRVF